MSRDTNREKEFLGQYKPSDYPSIALAADLVLFAVTGGVLHTALVRRGGHPFKDRLCTARRFRWTAGIRRAGRPPGAGRRNRPGTLAVAVSRRTTGHLHRPGPRPADAGRLRRAPGAAGHRRPGASNCPGRHRRRLRQMAPGLRHPRTAAGLRPRYDPPRRPGPAGRQDGVHHRRHAAAAQVVHHDAAPHRLRRGLEHDHGRGQLHPQDAAPAGRHRPQNQVRHRCAGSCVHCPPTGTSTRR